MIKTKKQMFVLIGAFILTIILGTVTYAFFNYTRTGTANTLRTGRIAFNAEQGDTVTLSDLFPITLEENETVTDQTPGVGSLSIHVTGDTTYDEGIEYLVKAVNVTSASNNQSLPISIEISYDETINKTIGTEDEEYFDKRGGNTSYYKVLSTDKIENNGDILVGYIAPGQEGIDGYITILAYLDARNIVITDTVEDGNIEVPGYENGTDTNWIGNRTVFTTEEWNALQTNGISFQIKVEANEGTWVEENRTVNAMNTFPSAITNEKANIKEVYFNKMGATRMQNAYDAATIKADLTANNEGKVLAWLEENPDDNTKYNLIVASDGDTYFPINSGGMFVTFSNLTKVVFNNINTIRVTNMNGIFNGCSSLATLDLSSFDTRNVTNMAGAFINVGVTKLDLSVLDTRNVSNMDGFVMNCSNLEEINASGLGSNVLYDLELGYNCPKLKKLDMSNFNFGLLTSYNMVSVYPALEEVSFENAQMPNFNSFSWLFYNISTLKTINLSGIDTSNITSTIGMFSGDSSLERIYVSNTWNMSNVTNSANMFSSCTSLVGQTPNNTYAFTDYNTTDKTYAVIATDNTVGYLTSISFKTN